MKLTFPKDLGALKFALMEKQRQRYRNRKYLDDFKDMTCIASDNGFDLCGATAIPAHIRTGNEGGMGLKPDDCLCHPLCDRHHKIQHSMSEEKFIIEYIYKPMIRRMFLLWYEDNN